MPQTILLSFYKYFFNLFIIITFTGFFDNDCEKRGRGKERESLTSQLAKVIKKKKKLIFMIFTKDQIFGEKMLTIIYN